MKKEKIGELAHVAERDDVYNSYGVKLGLWVA